MKKVILPVFLSFTLFLISCNKEQISHSETESPERFVLLNNEKILVPKGVDSTALQIKTSADAGKYVMNVLNKAGGRAKDLSTLNPEALNKVLLEIDQKYPNFDFSLDLLPESQLSIIKRDFPEIKSQEEAYNKRETIALYYENLKRYELIERIKSNTISNNSGGRTSSQPNYPNGWGWLVTVYTEACIAGETARSQTFAERNLRFGCDWDGGYSNAFQHSVWCGLIARKLIAAGKSKENGTGEAGIVTSAYECASVVFDLGAPNNLGMEYKLTLHAAMDLYNNSIGRSYIYHNTTFGLFGIRKNFPSEQRLIDEMTHRICSGTGINTFYNAYQPPVYPFSPDYDPAPLLSYVQSPQSAAWETLYRHTQSNWTHLMIVGHHCFCN